MGPITSSLCHSPVLGIAMWLSTLCAFPPPMPEKSVSLDAPGLILSSTFDAPIDYSYQLILTFTFPTLDDRLKDKFVGDRYATVAECDGTVRYEEIPAERRIGLGEPVPLKVTVTDLSSSETVFDKTTYSLCEAFHDGKLEKGRIVSDIGLKRGKYRIEVTNILSEPAVKGIKIGMMLAPHHAK